MIVRFYCIFINNRPLKLTPSCGCKFHAFLQRQNIQWPREFHRCVMYQFYGLLLIHTIHLDFLLNLKKITLFENLPLKKNNYKEKIGDQINANNIVHSFAIYISTFKIWKLPDHYVKSYSWLKVSFFTPVVHLLLDMKLNRLNDGIQLLWTWINNSA